MVNLPDQALMALMKCHLISFIRWEVFCALVNEEWMNVFAIAERRHKPLQDVEDALNELETEGVVERRPDGYFRLIPDEPTTRAIQRLVEAARRDHSLRQMIVNRIVGSRTQNSVRPN